MTAHIVALLWSVSCASTTGAPQGSGGDRSAGTGGKADSGLPENGSGGAPVGSGGAPGSGSGGSAAPGTGGAPAGSGGTSGSGGGPGSGGSPGTGGAQAGTTGTTGTTGSIGGEGGGRAGAGGPSGRGGAGAGGAGSGDSGGSSGCDFSSAEGRIVLFDGASLASWQNVATGGAAQWRLVGDGSMEVVPMNPSTNIQTTMKFDDLCLHIEYMTPMYAASVTGQQRGNSGIYFRRAYEMQVLDSYGQPPLIDGCGAVYGISPPMVVACNMQLVWNTYEIEFKASQWDASGRKTKNAMFVLARLNDQVVQSNVDLNVSMTTSGQPDAPGPQPIMLQDHGNTVRYRNIWAKIRR